MSSWFVVVHLLGAVQGAFLGALLMTRQRGSVANRILGWTMLAFALDLAIAVYHATGYDAVAPHLIGADYPLALLYGPLIYLYAKTLSRREQVFAKAHLWHLLPFALLVLLMVPFYMQSGAEKLAFVYDPEPGRWTQALGLVNSGKLVHALVYIGLTLALLRRHRRRIRDTFSFTEHVNLVWLRNLMVGIIALTGTVLVFYGLALQDRVSVMGLDPSTAYDDYTLLSLALFVYAIGFMGLRQPEVFDGQWRDRPMPAEGSPVPEEDERVEEPDPPRYARSGMDLVTAERCKEILLERMEAEKLYQRGDLTLQDLADAVAITPHNLTEVINTQLGQSFYDFVNGYRVREVQARLTDPESAHLTLLALGLEAGFNSKSSFYAVFKKHTKMTPAQYRAQAGRVLSS